MTGAVVTGHPLHHLAKLNNWYQGTHCTGQLDEFIKMNIFIMNIYYLINARALLFAMEELSEEQRLALEEKRQRSEKISRLMSPYLLKRYRMLNENCAVCEVREKAALQVT